MVFIYKIDYEKIRDNIIELSKNDYIVLKSNAYGFGFEKVLDIAYDCGIRKFCVITIIDAILIKEKYNDSRVLLLGPMNKNDLSLYIYYQIEISITSDEDFMLIENYDVLYQVEVNTGMNRFGVKSINSLELNNDKRFKGVYSHNATSDINYINDQIQNFFENSKYVINKDIHFASSSTKNMNIPFASSRRIGCAIYNDSLTVYGTIVQVNFCKKGEYLGYDYTYKFENDSHIGVIDLGYADGLERRCEGFLVYVKGKTFPLIGRACMNHSFVLLDEESYLNEEVTIIGGDNKLENYLGYFQKIPHEVYISFLKRY